MGLSGLDASAADVTGADVIVVDPFEVTVSVEDDDGNPLTLDNLWGQAINTATVGSAYFNIQSTDSTTINLQPGDYEVYLYASEASLDSGDISSNSPDTVYTDGTLTVDGIEPFSSPCQNCLLLTAS